MAAGVVHIPWYATLFRSDVFAEALNEFAPTALRYGATDYRVYRSRDDAYKFLHLVSFEDKPQFEAYWYGPEFNNFRARYSSYYQVPVLYVWHDITVQGALDEAPAVAGAPNGLLGDV
jgi:hypothetical protein